MTLINNISQHFLRTVFSLVLMLCTALGARAWDGQTAIEPDGAGTVGNPFIIATAENLYFVAQHPGFYELKYLKQTADIDLGGNEWIPIGNSEDPFSGIYDGQSHAIMGLSVDWGNYALGPDGKTRSSNDYAYGLFGYLTGSVENLVIDGASIYQSQPKTTTKSGVDMRVGILAGAVGCTDKSYIRNILIRNSSITSHPDNSAASGNYFSASAYMIGSLVGDVHANDSYTSSSEVKANVDFKIQNIYVEANITVNCILNPDRSISNKGQQYYAGGLIGRARSLYIKHMPKHAVYGGTINVPIALVGPIFGGARANGGDDVKVGTYPGLVNTYAGDFWDKALGTATDGDFTNTYYSNYRVQDYSGSEATEKLINDTESPATLYDNALDTHTLKAQASFTINAANLKKPENMAMFQGVNRGTYMATINATTQEGVIEMLNTDNTSEFCFVWRNNRVEMQGNVEIDYLQRTSIFRGQAQVRNLRPDQTYTYRWTLADAQGNTWWATCTTANMTQTNSTGEVVLKILSNDKVNPSCAIVGTMRAYTSIKLEIFEGKTTDEAALLATNSYDQLSDLHIDLVRDIKTSTTTTQVPVLDENGDPKLDDDDNPIMQDVTEIKKEHFLFTADMVIDDNHITTNPDFFDGIECQWLIVDPKVTDVDGDGFVPLSSSTDYKIAGTFPSYEAHISPTYVGNIRLKVVCHNPDAPETIPLTVTSSTVDGNKVNYIEQVIKGLHLDLTMEEFYGELDESDLTKSKIYTIPFVPEHYHTNPAAGKDGFYDYNNTTYSAGLITGEIGEKAAIKPLIFKVKVVDQFGNDWTQSDHALSRYRIQWNYRISGEGNGAAHTSPDYDTDGGHDDGDYVLVNGRFDKDATDKGLTANIPVTSRADYIPRNGQFALINDSILIIHPNLLHRTSAFWVRVRLFDIKNDPDGNHPAETILAYNQLGIKISKNTAQNTLDGMVLWKLDPEEKLYVSGTSKCELDWYKSSDPTDPDSWEWVDGRHNDPSRAITLNPEKYDSTCFYKLVYVSGSDLVVEQIYGPQNVVYVYNHAQTTANLDRTTFRPYDQKINMYYPTGIDTNHGHDPYHAVATMEQAYKILDADSTANYNVVVVMGYLDDRNYLAQGKAGKYARRATITGTYGNIIGSTIRMGGTDSEGRLLGCATTFKDLNWYGDNQQLHFYCGLNDVTFDTGVKMKDYAVQEANNNGLGDYTAPHITIVSGFHNRNEETDLVYPSTNADPTKVTMTFHSGTFGRIISGARNSGTIVNQKSHNIFGSPGAPHRVKVVLDIQDERTDEEKAVHPYDIGLLVGGQTDGTLYTESVIDLKAGTVGRFISGNISYGRDANRNSNNVLIAGSKFPSDSFYGSTTLNMRGGLIRELYGGTLGRHESSKIISEQCDAYFYGRSIINIYEGLIESNIYGAGAGGVTGVGDHDHHTNDIFIPYYTSATSAPGTKPLYGSFDEIEEFGYTIPTMTMSAPGDRLEDDGNGVRNVLDLAKSYVEVNVYGGTINGNIYGGGCGYSNHIDPDKAFDQAGYLFGNCYVNITGGTVDGNVYGGGEGSDEYLLLTITQPYCDAIKSGHTALWVETKRREFIAAHNDEWLAGNFANSEGYVTKAEYDAAKAKFGALAHVYGNTDVKISGGTITGNIYGGGQGIVGLKDMAKVTGNTSVTLSGDINIVGKVVNNVASGGHVYGGASMGEIRGNTSVSMLGGYIGGNVFGGSEGSAKYPYMATVYGKTNLLLDGAQVNASIYGGCNVSSIRKPAGAAIGYGEGVPLTKATVDSTYKSMTKVIVNSGEIGNNIYGGSRGNTAVAGSETVIEGDTYVRINGGSYKNIYYLTNKQEEPITDSQGNKRYRDFNIFGGGEHKCTINGTAHLDVRSGLMNIPSMVPPALPFYDDDEMQEAAENAAPDSLVNIFIPHEENPNSLEKNNTSKFQGPYMDYTYRRFSLYGGGYGEQTNCLNTDVYVYIPTDKRKPHGRTLKVPYDHQSFFDIAGGGYSGDIGYWDATYDNYIGGNCKVTIDGFTYCRKVIGGGFYGSCNTTNTKVICGSLRQVYGGSLLGYVHKQAFLEIGNRPEQLTGYTDPAMGVDWDNEKKAKWLNDYIYFTENVYGGNDVKGIIGTQKWRWKDGPNTYYGQEGTDGGPLWQADVDKEEDKGVVMNIFGGTFMGDVFGAGNGHYRGYYVPGWLRYEDGPARMYRNVRCVTHGMTYDEHLAAIDNDTTKTDAEKAAAKADIDIRKFRVYRTRPMVGSVNINITGNSADDMVHFRENFYGGGRECSIGQWNTILPMEDPRRLSVGGHLHINIGGNVNFDKNLYMGVYGGLYGSQQYLPAGIDLDEFHGQTTTTLEEIGEAAYDHWFFNKDYSSDKRPNGRYEPGFPASGKVDGNFGLRGEHMLRGYFKNIEMEGDVELTFYKNLYDSNGNRKRWVPGEKAVKDYDATNITMNSFFLGGKCGYMTNNNVMNYTYSDNQKEQFGTIYRITMPEGVTIKDKLVMGVEDAVTKFYPYSSDFTSADSVTVAGKKVMPDPMYIFEGGLVTQTTYSFDHVVYNDMMTKANKGVWNPTITLPTDFYQETDSVYNNIKNLNEYTLQAGVYAGKKIYRSTYYTYGLKNYMLRPDGAGGYITENNQQRRYGLAVTLNENNDTIPFFGRRASRTAEGDHQTVTKLTARCEFAPQKGTKPVTVDPDLSDNLKEDEYHKLYGGIIYGGCYNSGVVIGDVILNVASNMLGKNVTPDNQSDWFDHISGLGHYIGRVYGGGYGKDTRNDGDTYINLLRNVQAMNVFGGGMQGDVTGDTYINYIGTDSSYVYGAIYGGGFQGTVGKYYWRENFDKDTISAEYLKKLNDQTRLLTQKEYDRLDSIEQAKYHLYVENNGTNLTFISGNVDHVYGGSCMGNLYGATQVHLYDEVTDSLPHLDFSKYDTNFKTDWSNSRLIVGTVYGGNDISGDVIHTDLNYQMRPSIYDTNVTMTEKRDASGNKTTPGALNGYNGFPLVGNLYGGSNGDYGEQRLVVKNEGQTDEKSYYVYDNGSKIKFASGRENEIIEINIGAANKIFDAPLSVPNVDRANIEIEGGTVVNLYGGGDMSTITGKTNIKIAYAIDTTKTVNNVTTTTYGNIEARAGFKDDADVERVWNTCHVTSRQQMAEVMNYGTRTFYYNIYRIFGGNNHADMSIQPSWQLTSGHVGSVYSGANFGKMTFFDGSVPTKPRGLELTINSRNFHANAVYGGGRVGDVFPTVPEGTDTTALYGATLTIKDGVIDNVYGGNDVSGEVHYGSKVDIQGAISGNVYCAGNGNYVYKYGYPADYTGDKNIIGEDYIITDQTTKSGYRYFILPAKAAFGGDSPTDLQKVQAINNYRPNVSRSSLAISGLSADNPAYVHGSVYMGGNSATVLPKAGSATDFIEFNIGSNVIINSIFMGSNGELLVDNDMVTHTNDRNGFSIGGSDDMLNAYFKAVDVEGMPKDFRLAPNITNANIGDFFLGGNRGSMTTNQKIELEFPENITIFGKIVGGSNNANYEYATAKHTGGLNTPLAAGLTDKVHLKVRSKFLPKHLKYPDGDWRAAELVDDIRDSLGVLLYRKYEGGKALAYYDPGFDSLYTGDKTYLSPGMCNIYGGCYNSGVTVGNVKIDLFSDMLLFGPEWKGIAEEGKSDADVLLALRTREQTVVNCIDGIKDKCWHPFSVIGGGYGAGTSVYGNINVRLLPTKTATGVSHPSCAAVFGGAQEGVVVGNTTVELRDGTVLANVYGASESSHMYGSTQILIGYPKHYDCLASGEYKIARADTCSKAVTITDWKTNKNDGSEVVKQSVWYRKGDIVPKNVFDQIVAADATQGLKFTYHHEDAPDSLVKGVTWDDINISVGDPSSRNARTATDIATIPYFGYGNVYGGGFVPTAGNSALIGQKTLRRFRNNYKPIDTSDLPAGHSITSYGGNSAIMIWDNPDNATKGTWNEASKKYTGSDISEGAAIRDHVSIGTGQFLPVTMTEGKNKMGLYYFKPASGSNPSEFVHQPSGNYSTTADAGKTFYEIVGDGGIFGGGRKVYNEGFSACDLAYYGYADYTPQMAKLVNTFQRLDLLSLTDCCLQLQASQDFASTTSDAGEKYSITRVGELRMNSSLAGSGVILDEGVADSLNIGNTNHKQRRSRNFLGFYRSVKFLGALVSNVGFENGQYHTDQGVFRTDTTYLTKKQLIVDTYYTAKKREENDKNHPVTNEESEAFKQRNVGTSANMIGINNGYSLRIQGTRLKKEGGSDVDESYYGPAFGVTEIKLLTMAVGEGGGYVYALNKHKEEAPNASPSQTTTRAAGTHLETPNFLQTLGNFVFPGAKFGLKEVAGVPTPTMNYIIDDCFPIGHGYDKYMADTANHNNVNETQEIHYWYVNGQRYFFNATLTAYTGTPEEGKLDFFTIDNSDNLMMLAGIDSTTQYLRVKSIKWEAPNAAYDLTRTSGLAPDSTVISSLLPGYNLYVTVGDKPQDLIRPSDENKQNAWTAQLKRTDYKLVDTETDASGNEKFKVYPYDDVNIAPVAGNNNAGNGKYKATMPLLGLALTDSVANNGKEYYAEHLSQPSKMQVVLGARNSDGDYEYTLNLTIVYLKGTDVTGHIVIENCALPGERIYANAFDVKVEGDDPNITNRQWVLYKIDVKEDNSTEELPALTIPEDFRVEENSPERIALPAYLWMNGWHLGYEMTINGKPERVLTSLSDTTEHKVINVHNYHRMMAWDRKTNNSQGQPDYRDLQLTTGARVYIEDADDLAQFFTYMNDSVQDNRFGDTDALKKAHRGHIGSAVLPAAYDTHVVVNPRYAEGIHFILLDDVEAKAGTTPQTYQFEGRLSGLGHNIKLGDCTQFMGENGQKGSIYFTGFRSTGTNTVFGTNNGRVMGCFHYNTSHTGTLMGEEGERNDLQYCYQNSYPGENDPYGYTTYYNDLDFANGKAAYDLNAFYLNERYKRATGNTGNENDRFKSYVYNYYGDGNYRYANWDKVTFKGTATALRSKEHPNYYIMAKITPEQMAEMAATNAVTPVGIAAAAYGKASTYHNCAHLKDESRKHIDGHYVEVEVNGVKQPEWIPDYYEPNFPQDFIFYGQDIKQNGNKYPVALKEDGTNRVYRASGFYGTQVDSGYYFNRAEAVMLHPRLTAVDFTGQRMRDGANQYLLNKQVFPTTGTTKQALLFPPVLDLPRSDKPVEGTTDATAMQLGGMNVVGNSSIDATDKVTKNLLVYVPTAKVTGTTFWQHKDEEDIEAHRINWLGDSNFQTDSLHLVDKQDFNAPIAFNITDRAWYERKPLHYASRSKSVGDGFVIGKDAWEGISLPFTANIVRGVNCTGLDAVRNRGEISHFYGNSTTHHDYWLRGLVDTNEDTYAGDDVIAAADFARPGNTSGLFNYADQATANYVYANDWLYNTYAIKGYLKAHDEYAEPLTFENYCYLTKNAPYIAAFPGEDYYEFDLSGQFFYDKLGEMNTQKIVYENKAGVTIAVTDDEASKRCTTVTGKDGTVTTHYGTFAHTPNDGYYVLNEAGITAKVQSTTDAVPLPAGSAFINCAHFGISEVLPFRTYMTTTLPASATRGFIAIGATRGIDNIGDSDEDEDKPQYTGVQIYAIGNTLYVTSDHDFTLPIYGVAGQLYANLTVHAGKNAYRGLRTGVYVTRGTKFVIRR